MIVSKVSLYMSTRNFKCFSILSRKSAIFMASSQTKMQNSTEHAKLPRPGVGVGVFVTSSDHPGTILMGKRKNSTGSGMYALPGGHLEFGESWEECGRREIMEETGLRLKDVSFAHVNNAIDRPTNYHYVTIFMKGEVDTSFKAEPENMEPDKCEGWHWTKWEDIPPPELLFWSLRIAIAEGFNMFAKKD